MKRTFTVSVYLIVVLICHVSFIGALAKNTPDFPCYKNMNSPKHWFSVNNQTCPTNIELYSQEDIDMFSVNYGGCTELPGYLAIYDLFGNITNLNGLSGITSIAGELYIFNNQNLTNLNGLENLGSVGGDLYIESNSVLVDINALGNLSGSISSLNLVGNSILPNLVGLEGILGITNHLNIQDNESLQSLNGINNVATIGRLTIAGNNSLSSLSGLNGVQEILGSLSIENNFNLLNLNGLDNLNTIGGELFIYTNNALSNLSGLNGVQEILESLIIENNINLLNLNGLNNLNSIGGRLVIWNNIDLRDISALNNVSGSVSSLEIAGDHLTTLIGLGGLESITGNLTIVNSDLHNLSGLENLNSIQGNLLIINSFLLNDISALNNVSGSISSINITGSRVSSLNGLSGITHVAGNLRLFGNVNLISLSGLINLSSIGGVLEIRNNSNLSSIEGLINLTVVNNGIGIYDNSSLSICHSSLCNHLLNATGIVNISNNAYGCNSNTEVIERCVGLGCTSVSSPPNGSNFVATNATILWTEAYGASGYKISIGTSSGGDQILELTDLGQVTEYQPVAPLPFESQIFIKIVPYVGETELNNCEEVSFNTTPEFLPCPNLLGPANGANVNIAIFASVLTFTWSSVMPGISYGFYLGTTPENAVLVNTVPGTNMPITQGMLDTLFIEKQTYHWFVVPLIPGSDFSSCQTNARSFTLNCHNFHHNFLLEIRTDGDSETSKDAILELNDVTVVIDIFDSASDPAPFLSVDTFPGFYYPDINFIKSVPGKPTAVRLTRECIDGTMITLMSSLKATLFFDYCSSCINYPAPEGPSVINPRCVVINQDQIINLTMKSAYHLPGNYDFDGVFPNNSTGVPTPGKELFFNFSPTETAHYGIQINEVSNNSYISYLFKEDDGVSACEPAGWTGLARVNGPMDFDIGTLEVGKTYKFVMAAEDTVSTRHSFILFKAAELDCPEDQEMCISADPVVLQGDGQFSGSGVTDGNFNPSVAGEGVHEITYTLDGQSCSFFITVFGLPDITCPENQFICLNEDPFIITGESLPGGTYEGTGVTDGEFDPASAGLGAHNITYTFTDAQACTNNCSFTFSIIEPADVICPDDIEACITSLSAIPLSVNGYPDGVFTGPGVSLAGNEYVFNPSQAELGENTISFVAIDQNGCFVSCSFIAMVVPEIELTDLQDLQFCSNSTSSNILEVEGYSNQVFQGEGVQLIDFQYFFNPSLVSPGEYSITFEASDVGAGCIVTGTFIISVIEPQNISCPDNMEIHIADGLVELSVPDYPDGIFTGPGVQLTSGVYYFDPSVTGGGIQEITFNAQDTNSCEVSCTFEILINNEVFIDCPENTEYCTSDNSSYPLFLEEYPSGEFSGPGVTLSNGLFFFSPSEAGEGEHVISFSELDPGGIIYLCSFTSNVYEPQGVSCPQSLSLCANDEPLVLSGGLPEGGSYDGAGVFGGVFDPAIAGPGDFAITYSYTDENNCDASCEFLVTVHELPTITCPEDQSFCTNENAFKITGGFPIGGTYEGTGVTDGDFDPALAGSGAHIIIYTFIDEQLCVNSCSFTFSVFDPADVICPDNIEACITSLSAIPLSVNGYSDGVFTGSGVSFSGSGYVFNPSQAELGENTITFNALDQNGCAISCSFMAITISGIELTDLPDQQYCNSSADDFLLSMPDYPDGVFSGPGVSQMNSQYFFTPSVLPPGDYFILFEATSGGCIVSGTFLITIIAPENIICPPNMDVDPDNTLYLLSTPDYTQGIFNGPGVVIIDGFYYFDPLLAGGGTHSISYTVQDVNGCTTSCSFQVFVNSEIPINCPDDLQFCTTDNSLHLLFVAEYPLGVFSGIGVESNNGQYFFNPSLAGEGLHGITFSYITNNGFNYFCDFTIIVVTEILIACPDDFEVPFNSNINYPLSVIDYPDGIFEGPGIVFSDFTYSFQPGSANLGENVINFTANGTDGCLLTCSFIITTFVEDICPDIEATMTGDQMVCPGEEVWLTVNISGGEAPYLLDIQNPESGILTFTTEEEGESVFLLDNPLNGVYILVGVIDSNDCPANVSGISQVSTEDTTPPVAICQDVFITPDNEGNYFFSAGDIDSGSSDNCGIVEMAIDIDWIDCSDATSTIVTLTVTDVSGNISTCVSTVTPMGDSDCDGVGDVCDLCPGGDDSIDNNGDGLPDCKYRPAYSQIIPEWKCGNNRVYVCKIPPGNPANAHTICVSYNAVNAHLNTGSFLGPCGSANCDEVYFTPLIDSSDEEVTEWRAGHGFEIYPNPTYGDLTVVFEPGTEEGDLLVTDLHGKALVTYAITSGHQQVRLQLPEMPPGTYLIRHQNNQSLRINKLMIIRH